MEEKEIKAKIVIVGITNYIDFDERIPFLKDGDRLVYRTTKEGSIIVAQPFE